MTFNNLDAIRATARMAYGLGGPDLENTMSLELLSPPSLTDAQAQTDIGEFMEVLYSTIQSVMPTGLQFIDITIQNLTADAAPLVAGWPTFVAGLSAGVLTSPQIAALVLARTAVSRKTGRVYVPGMNEAGVQSGVWVGSTLTALQNFAAQLLLTQVRTNGNWRYAVRTRAVVPPPTNINSYDIPISASVILNARTQRRRSLGFGS